MTGESEWTDFYCFRALPTSRVPTRDQIGFREVPYQAEDVLIFIAVCGYLHRNRSVSVAVSENLPRRACACVFLSCSKLLRL